MAAAQPSTTAPQTFVPPTFPRPETALARMIRDPGYRKAFRSRLQTWNRYIVFFYKIGLLPLVGAARGIMLLTTIGRRSRRQRAFPVGYFRLAGEIYQISGWGKSANWYKNIQANPRRVELQIGFRRFPVEAQFIEEPHAVQRVIEQLITESPSEAKRILGWDPSIDSLEATDFGPLAGKVMFVRYVPLS